MEISFDNRFVYIRFEGGNNVAFQVDRNKFETESGLTISNIDFPVPVYLVSLSSAADSANFEGSIVGTSGTTLECGNVIENLFATLKSQVDNVILIVDFDKITNVSENFCKLYMQYLLTTNNKVITINQNIDVSNVFSNYVLSNIEIKELE